MTIPSTPDACVRKFLDLSTIHVKPTTCEALSGTGLSTRLVGENGFMIWVPPAELVEYCNYPPELHAAFTVARTKYPDVAYLMFDADAPENSDFLMYEDLW